MNKVETSPILLSPKQLQVIKNFGIAEQEIHCGPYGCGKTFSINVGLGRYLMEHKAPGGDNYVLIVGRTKKQAETTVLGGLQTLYGDRFTYTTSKKDGFVKDALFDGHMIRTCGANDSNAEALIRGINAYIIVADEVSTYSGDFLKKLIGRLRGKLPEGQTHPFFIGSTNPEDPEHELLRYIKKTSILRYVEWNEFDNIIPDARSYYERLRETYKHSPALLKRYVYGKWAASEGLVYTEFNPKYHVMDTKELLGATYSSIKIGLDYGVDHPTGIVYVGVMPGGEQIVLKELALRGSTNADILKRLAAGLAELYIELGKQVELSAIYIDPSAKGMRLELETAGYPVRAAVNDVIDGIGYVKNQLVNDNLIIADRCVNLIKEFYAYTYKGKDKLTVIKLNDDLLDSLRYVLYSSK